MAKMTRKQTRALFDAHMLVLAAIDRVFLARTRTDIPFEKCFAAASDDTRNFYIGAANKLSAIEAELIAQNRGYRAAFGHFKGYE